MPQDKHLVEINPGDIIAVFQRYGCFGQICRVSDRTVWYTPLVSKYDNHARTGKYELATGSVFRTCQMHHIQVLTDDILKPLGLCKRKK